MKSWRRYDRRAMPPILEAALDAIVEMGYHGTTIRKIADRAGLSVPGVYHHYPSKHALLVAIMEFAMEDLWQRTTNAIGEANGVALGELDRYVECMVLFHANEHALASIALTEIRSLNPEAREAHIHRRDRQHEALNGILEKGKAIGVFNSPYLKQASTAIITMCTSVSQWFDLRGELTPTDLAGRYQRFAQNIAKF